MLWDVVEYLSDDTTESYGVAVHQSVDRSK